VDFLIAKDDLHRCRLEQAPAPRPQQGQALLTVDAFGLSANNITYAVFGEAMAYWSFFPAAEGWGRMPVWGFAEVAESRHPELAEGTRVYGYLPPSTQLLVTPAGIERQGFTDASPHRSELPAAYNSYARVDADPSYDPRHEDEQMLLRPLFFTSYLLDDFLADGGLLGEGSVVISSASSKTASALAFLLARRGAGEVIGLTSPRGADFTRSLGVYGRVVPYEEITSLPDGKAVYVDISGDAAVRAAVHRHFGSQLVHSAVVGATHHDQMGDVPGDLPGARPALFFAPDRVAKRSREWGREGLEQRLAEAWDPYVEWTGGWLRVEHGRGGEALQRAYLQLLDGDVDPARAHVLSLQEEAG
jgi:NADPH:quinone reductase-like Zn-dependent oxidoreductase